MSSFFIDLLNKSISIFDDRLLVQLLFFRKSGVHEVIRVKASEVKLQKKAVKQIQWISLIYPLISVV